MQRSNVLIRRIAVGGVALWISLAAGLVWLTSGPAIPSAGTLEGWSCHEYLHRVAYYVAAFFGGDR